jgi:hypothetical protein
MARIWEGISEEDILDVEMLLGGNDWIESCLIDTARNDGFPMKRSGEHELFQGHSL